MELSNQKSSQLYDKIRKKWVAKTPEESIRQWLLTQMVDTLGYPPSLIAVEKELSQFPHVLHNEHALIPKRRMDIVVFKRQEESKTLVPLLMVECKAVPLSPAFAQQVIGYNLFMGAPFLTLANEREVVTGYYDMQAGMYKFTAGLPAFASLTTVAA